MRIHVIELGRLQFPRGWFEARTPLQAMRAFARGLGGPADAIPILGYVIEHDEGHIVIDTGGRSTVARKALGSRLVRRSFAAKLEPSDEIDPQMRARGLRPEDIRLVLPTHLDWDHAGGVGDFPTADVRVHRVEWNCRGKLAYRWRFQSGSWPSSFQPQLYDLRPEPYGPWAESLPLTDRGDVVAVPTPGHSEGHVSFLIRTPDLTLLFAGDHLMQQRRYAADLARGLHPVNFYPRTTVDTNRKLFRFVTENPTLLLPSHDGEAMENLARWQPLRV